MSGIIFDKNELGNLEYSLKREILSTNRAGGYMSTTIICCNTRKYHGLLVVPVPELHPEHNFVLLSSLDETVVQHDKSFNLAIHKFPNVYEPKGHKYIVDFKYTPVPTITYRVGGVILKKEMLWIHSRSQLMIRYTLLEASSDTKLLLRPFLAFRDANSLCKANMSADTHSYEIDGGVKCKMYENFPWLRMQVDKENEYVVAPDWYSNFEYTEESKRGYANHEDQLTPGYFEVDIKKGESVIISCATNDIDQSKITETFETEIAKRSDKVDLITCLKHAARQFVIQHGDKTEMVAGYPWFGRWGRDTFIALPGLTLTQGNAQQCMDVLDTMVDQMKDGLFPNVGDSYNSVDAPLWFFWTLQQLETYVSRKEIWKKYGEVMKGILEAYDNGIQNVIGVTDNGLVWASHPVLAMTWMDAIVNGNPVTGREGLQVEVNALWYNAVCYTLDMAKSARNKKFIEKWGGMPEKIKAAFLDTFWMDKVGYLADYVDGDVKSEYIRPNQLIAGSLACSMLDESQTLSMLNVVKQHLLTPKGLRTLSPRNLYYKGRCEGSQVKRDLAYHQGTVHVWLLEHYVATNFAIHGDSYLQTAKDILGRFDEDISDYGVGTVAETYDGDPPHAPRGAVSQAWSVGSLLRIQEMIERWSKKKKK